MRRADSSGMEQPRYLISPRVAIGTAAIAGIALVLAIVTRRSEELERTAMAQPPSVPDAGEPVLDGHANAQDPDVAPPPIATVPPKINGAKAKASVGQLGIELEIDAAVTLAGPVDKRESVVAKASCKIDGEWYTGTGYLRLSRAPMGTNVITTKVRVGVQHAFTTPPTQCQLGFEYSSYAQKPSKREWLARMCWDGKDVTDKPCAVKPTEDLTVSGVRVSTSKYRRLNAPVDLEVSLDAELKRPLDDKRIEVAADCTLPNGSTHRSTARVLMHGVHAGRPFTSRAWLFGRGQQMLDVPASCTVAVEVADMQQLVREPVRAFCWKGGDVTAGACSA